ncbi:MAG: phosphodiester glycosidase family protein [Balneolaceae bacterium]|nr:MAG: phosphodiester glycosidase family protein [Balneolaceae bacterium]
MRHPFHYKKLNIGTLLTTFFITGYLLFLTGFSFDYDVQTSAPDIEITWQHEEEIAKCVTWKYYYGEEFFKSKQSINLIDVDLSCADLTASFAWSDSLLVKTSTFGEQNSAVAAINGTFFNMERGGSVVFFKVDGEVISRGAVNRRLYSESGGIAIHNDGTIAIVIRPEEGWLTDNNPTVMGSGPLLILNGEHQQLRNDPFNEFRHPRTAVGTTTDQRLLMITVDGRSSEAHGMSTPELREFMENIGAVSALNLDGGGSTAMWIAGKAENGIVSYPSDNRQFDRQGERGVANVLLLAPKK